MQNIQERIAAQKERKRLYEIRVFNFFKENIGRSIEQKEKAFVRKYFIESAFLKNKPIDGKIYLTPSLRNGRIFQPKIPESLQPFFKITRWNIFFNPLEYSLKIKKS